MYLITKWFGTFICEKKGIQKKILFSKDKKIIAKQLQSIENNNLLKEEKELSKGLTNLIINEKRLIKIGNYQPTDSFFTDFEINCEKFGYSEDLLHEATLIFTKNRVEKELASKDLQIIQMINTLDDLIQTSNLLSERLEGWSILPTNKKRIQPLKNTISTVKTEIKSLEKQIDNDMEKNAPNTSKIVGSIIGARLISYAGGIDKLAIMPASTIQILGAEKALFRFKKEGGKPPKHGVIFQHNLINKAPRYIRGKLSRIFALKISLAIKADAFTKRDISKKLKQDLDKQIKNINNQ